MSRLDREGQTHASFAGVGLDSTGQNPGVPYCDGRIQPSRRSNAAACSQRRKGVNARQRRREGVTQGGQQLPRVERLQLVSLVSRLSNTLHGPLSKFQQMLPLMKSWNFKLPSFPACWLRREHRLTGNPLTRMGYSQVFLSSRRGRGGSANSSPRS